MATYDSAAITLKIETARQKKETGDQAFKAGDPKAALYSYHEALMYLVGLDKSAYENLKGTPLATVGSAEAEQKSEIDDIISKVYANMSACHIKEANWKRAIETADKASLIHSRLIISTIETCFQSLAKNARNYKAMFRKGKALGEQGYFEKAEKILEKLKAENPADTVATDAELARLRAIENERDRASRQKMKGFLKKQDLTPQG
ncbi:hypothetical protein AX17_007355 [Amanita inopinata Kibby_2008]|nr:hypothetical protein AX17_007355 [Amanita inopinata Kibby_2008]